MSGMSASPRPYNFDTFDRQHVIEDVERTIRGAGVTPGLPAPDFSLPTTGGGLFTLSAHRHQPVLLRFASYT